MRIWETRFSGQRRQKWSEVDQNKSKWPIQPKWFKINDPKWSKIQSPILPTKFRYFFWNTLYMYNVSCTQMGVMRNVINCSNTELNYVFSSNFTNQCVSSSFKIAVMACKQKMFLIFFLYQIFVLSIECALELEN